jgi:hypothetical protein
MCHKCLFLVLFCANYMVSVLVIVMVNLSIMNDDDTTWWYDCVEILLKVCVHSYSH